jgi:TAG lipase/steryl ester hydrolase/phospholipase A2/LPA acyltransferase
MVATSEDRVTPTIDLSPRRRMKQATSYEEWKQAAIAEDERSGAARWKNDDRSRRYDYEVIRSRFDEIREVRASGDPHRILFYLNEGIHGNTGGIGSSALYRRSHFGTKNLVTNYTSELAGALDDVASAGESEIPIAERLEFFRRASDCFGRTALMYSGGGMLGLFHVGVSKALVQEGLLPNVLSGASAGSIVAAILGTLDGSELEAAMEGETIADAFAQLAEGSLEFAGAGSRMRVDEIRSFIDRQIPDLTFAEAFEKTGRRINITISPRQLHQQSRIMNAITSPNVMIRETVLASCAIPGIFPPVTLAAKDRSGARVPYVASRQWVDGSVTNDLPARQLARIYGVNHFVTSQTNPIVLWSLRDTAAKDSLAAKLWEISQNAARESFRATYPLSMRLTRSIQPMNLAVRMAYAVATQTYTADINILPRRRSWNPSKLLSVLSEEETRGLIEEGEASTWPKIEQLRNATRVSRRLDAILDRLESEALLARA